MDKTKKKIILTGGGTAGSVSPLLAVAEIMPDYDFLWVGTKTGPEKEMVKELGIKFQAISSGKFRRYLSLQNLIDPFRIIWGFFQSIGIILKNQPDLVMSAGSFVSVPVVWAAWLLSVPVLIHQQDVRPGLANKLMAFLADHITVAFEKSLKDYGKQAILVGNPVRLRLKNFVSSTSTENQNPLPRQQAEKIKNILNKDLPVVLVVGGGTGAVSINNIVAESLGELTKFCQIIHITGIGKKDLEKNKNYLPFEFLSPNDMAEVLQIADVVVSRAGMGLATEVSFLGKPTIFIPMPDSHQEENAQIFDVHNAAIVLNQKKLTSKDFIDNIKKLLESKNLQEELSKNIKKIIKTDATEKIVEIVKKITKNK